MTAASFHCAFEGPKLCRALVAWARVRHWNGAFNAKSGRVRLPQFCETPKASTEPSNFGGKPNWT
eukprot:CAMPEP_0184279528 /NCGR_PEP_ID=MMETSP0977-20130417/56098_1 /TAXON_ID=483370 /ORGANISM="non described non described, Strain CCMP2097" /LENGTH=64 /DNA_ID=CAMNT_0026585471 /DNA_START=55 /DNA_END=246 /DNA_ORIENTATION=+